MKKVKTKNNLKIKQIEKNSHNNNILMKIVQKNNFH